MKRLRVIVVIAATAVLGLVAAPAASAGPESGLQALCEQVAGGTWGTSGALLNCDSGSFELPNPGARAICENALGGQVYFFDSVPQPGPRGWTCDPTAAA